MVIRTDEILDVMRRYGIQPLDDEFAEIDLPGIGVVGDNEAVYATSLAEVLGDGRDVEPGSLNGSGFDDSRMLQWRGSVEQIVREGRQVGRARRTSSPPQPPEPCCAWYCPIHFFGHGWGIYIRESCVLSQALDLAYFVDWRPVSAPLSEIARQLLRSAFYSFYLHEQFHHKVESLGLRLLVSTGSDRYRPYKTNVYRPAYGTSDCIEESLANAESYRRVGEQRYAKRVDPAIRAGLRAYLKWSFPKQPPGYQEGVNYLAEQPYRNGLYSLQSQLLDGKLSASTPKQNWAVAPNMITSLADIADDIYVVLPRGARPLFPCTSMDPGATASTREMESALTKHYGYRQVPGGKGSHVKLSKEGRAPIILPGNRPTLSPGIVKQVLHAVVGGPLSRLPDFLEGRLSSTP